LTGRLQPLVLADLPTPVVKLKKLEQSLGHSGLYLKQDNLSSRLYGGNKVRKLEFLLGQAKLDRVTTLLTMGGFGSNHLLATSLHGRSLGLRTVGVVFPQPDCAAVRRNMAANLGAGTELIKIPSKYLLPIYIAKTLAEVRLKEGRLPRLIPGGGSSPLGALGFVNAGLELAAQIVAGELPEPQAVFLPYGTGGTAAGLALGLQLAGLNTKVLAVRVIDRLIANRPRLVVFLRALARLLASGADPIGLPARLGANLEIVHEYIGPGYGHSTPEAVKAVNLFSDLEDVQLELTYTGKAAAAFWAHAESIKGPLLFWNTYSSADIDEWVTAGQAHG
ncbi:MAG: pyridoxal-phosphate dependent enzyme, partial [Deltaproteobacteria bacterium]|nr:pyridoxal-phosphate dependent enzyme [Deltaproteobacteria bacterium]